jgi:hypothetical protein
LYIGDDYPGSGYDRSRLVLHNTRDFSPDFRAGGEDTDKTYNEQKQDSRYAVHDSLLDLFTRELVATIACQRRTPAPIGGQACRHYSNAFPTFFFPLSFLFGHDFPADSTDSGFETQSADNLLEQQILPAGAGQNGVHFYLVRMLDVVAL